MSGDFARAPEPGQILMVRLGIGEEHWRPPLFPGSQEAADEGCICPIEQPWPGAFYFNDKCQVHELTTRKH